MASGSDHRLRATVTVEYSSQQEVELSLRVGDVIKDVIKVRGHFQTIFGKINIVGGFGGQGVTAICPVLPSAMAIKIFDCQNLLLIT